MFFNCTSFTVHDVYIGLYTVELECSLGWVAAPFEFDCSSVWVSFPCEFLLSSSASEFLLNLIASPLMSCWICMRPYKYTPLLKFELLQSLNSNYCAPWDAFDLNCIASESELMGLNLSWFWIRVALQLHSIFMSDSHFSYISIAYEQFSFYTCIVYCLLLCAVASCLETHIQGYIHIYIHVHTRNT